MAYGRRAPSGAPVARSGPGPARYNRSQVSEVVRAVPRPAPETLRALLGMRVVVVSTLLLSALLIQLTFSIWLPLLSLIHISEPTRPY